MGNKTEVSLSILSLIPIGTTSAVDNALRIQAIGVLKEELEKEFVQILASKIAEHEELLQINTE